MKQIKTWLDKEKDVMYERCPFCKRDFRDVSYVGEGIAITGTWPSVHDHILKAHHLARVRIGNKYRWIEAEAEE